MARETKSKTIDGYEYTCTQFPPQKALRILTKLTKYLGGPLAALMASSSGATDLMKGKVEDLDFTAALTSLGNSMGDEDLYILAKDVCENVVVGMGQQNQGVSGQLKDNTFDEHFMGGKGLKRLFTVMIFALEVNYSDFLGDVVAKVSSVQAAT